MGRLDRSEAGGERPRPALGLPVGRQTVAAVRRLARAHAASTRPWPTWPGRGPDAGDRALYHVAGRRDFEAFAAADGRPTGRRRALAAAAGCYRVVPFEEQMPELYQAADVFVGRAGAMTVAELMVAGVPGLLVPLPGAPRDHQTRNAEALVAAGAAVLIPDAQCDGARLAGELESLLADPERLSAMSDGGARPGTCRRRDPDRRTGRCPCPLTSNTLGPALGPAASLRGSTSWASAAPA